MKNLVWYKVEFLMMNGVERDCDLDEYVGYAMGFSEDEIDEREPHRLTAFFRRDDTTPTEMREIVSRVLREHPEIYYIDVIYRFDAENVPDRFVIWNDGEKQEYIGKVVFEEDMYS